MSKILSGSAQGGGNGGGGGGGLLKAATIVMTQAQLLANGDTPVIIVPAPGAGNVAFPIATRAKLTFVSQAYTSAFTNGPYLWWENGNNAIGPILYPAINGDNFSYDLVAFASDTRAMYVSGLTANPTGGFDPDNYTNLPIVVQVGPGETLNAGPLQSVAITTPGTGYSVNDILFTVNAANQTNQSLLQVSSVNGSGGITGIDIFDGESDRGGDAFARNHGNVSFSTLNSGGSLYATGDTGSVTGGGNGNATYTINTVDGGGAVLTYTIDPNSGAGYTPSTNVSTTAGGDQPGIGTGFTVDVLSGGGADAEFDLTVLVGDGTLTVTLWYTIAPA